MKKKDLFFLCILTLSLGCSDPAWSLGNGLLKLRGEERMKSAETTALERRRGELYEEHFERKLDTQAELTEIDEERNLSEITLDHFENAVEQFPDAERFVLKKTSTGSLLLIAEDPGLNDPSKDLLEDQLTRQAFQLALQRTLPQVDFDHFFENENPPDFSPALGANKIKEILNYGEQAESILLKRNFFSANSITPQEKRTTRKIKSSNWSSAILPSAILFLNHITQAVAQPFANQASFWCPNGTKMGIVWEHLPKYEAYNLSQHYNTLPSTCDLAERLYLQAQHAAEKVSEICFQNLEHPNNDSLQQEWKNTFLQSIPYKEHWMLAEASCQRDLTHLQSFQLPHDWLSEPINANQHRQENWRDAARWHPSIYTQEFASDLYEYQHACVIDAAEKEGPRDGDKTRWVIARGADQFPYTRLESVFNTITGKLLEQSAIAANYIIATLPEEETTASFKKKLAYLDPDITLREASPYARKYFLEFRKISLQFLPKILEACRKLAISCNFDSIGSSTSSDVLAAPDINAYYNTPLLLSPNDANYTDQTNLKFIQASTAWASRHSTSQQIITVIDSGMHPHEDLNQNMWNSSKLPHHYGPYEYQHGFVADSSFNITPHDNHGTHCGGIIGAVGNNSLGITGIVWNTALMFCKATSLRSKAIDWRDIHVATCINHTLGHNSSIISASFRDLKPTPEVLMALAQARNAGIILVSSSGNDAKNLDNSSVYPASYAKTPLNPSGLDNIVVVGAVDDHDQWWPSSNYGQQTVHLAAPGVGVLSTVVHNNTPSYQRMSGTSMAVPHVAGTLALMKEHFPEKPYTWLIEKLLNATDLIPSLTNKTIYGRLNVAKALEPEAETCPAP